MIEPQKNHRRKTGPKTGPAPFRRAVALALLAVACDRAPATTPAPSPATTASPAWTFTDITEPSGVRFQHHNGATANRYLPETMGAGVAVFDADGDGRPDLFFVDSMPVAQLAAPPAEGRPGALYRNLGEGRFADITAESGLDRPVLGMGAAVGDIDNDGDLDLLVTGVGGERLYRNHGEGRFDDVSRAWGLATGGFGSSAAFLDYDRDGWLDLAVGRYLRWSPESDLPCRPDAEHRIYCTPEAYPGAFPKLYRNIDGERFEDVAEAAGLTRATAKTLGIAVLDLDGDLLPDLALANDTTPNFLYHNLGDGTFEEIGLEIGIAVGPSGSPRGGMGIAAGDLDGDGRPDLVIGNFAQEMASVYRRRDGDMLVDDAAVLGVGLPTLMELAFGTVAEDLDGDGRLDLVFANGHIEPEIARFQSAHTYAQPPALFRNLAGGGFERVVAAPGSALARPLVGRGLATGDLDGDGDLDLVFTQNGRPAVLLRNDSPPTAFLRLRLEGRRSNRSGFGARVDIDLGERTLHRWLMGGGSYLSASEPILTIGLGNAAAIDGARIVWPSGTVQELGALELGRLHHIVEPD